MKGVASITAMMLLFILLAGVSLFTTAYVISMVKLPLAVASGLLVFIYSSPLIRKYLRVGKEYGAICGAILGILTAYYIYRLDVFWLTIALGVLFGVGYFLKMMMEEIETFSDFIKLMEGKKP